MNFRAVALLGASLFLSATVALAADKPLNEQIPASGMTESVTLGAGAGKAEGRILATRALDLAAMEVARRVTRAWPAKPVIVLPYAADTTLPAWRLYSLRYAGIVGEGAAAKARCVAIGGWPDPGSKFIESVPGVADVIAAAAKLGSFFDAKYELQGFAVTADDDLLISAVAGDLKGVNYETSSSTPPAGGPDVYIGAGSASAAATAAFSSEIRGLEDAGESAASCNDKAQALLKANKDDAKAQLAAGASRAFLDDLSALFKALGDSPDKSAIPLARVLAERSLAGDMAGKAVLKVKTAGLDVSLYSRTTLWSFLGSMPVYLSGTAVVYYQLSDETGKLLAAGDVTRDTGVIKARSVHSK